MNKLDELIISFKEDKNWNTEQHDGSHRFDKEIAWIEEMINEYAEYFKLSVDDVVSIMESKRNYSWPNYYQKATFPSVAEFENLSGVYKTFDEFKSFAETNWKGFKCSKCGNIGRHPQECDHRVAQDGKCDWCSYGLFTSSDRVIILEDGFKVIHILEPVLRD